MLYQIAIVDRDMHVWEILDPPVELEAAAEWMAEFNGISTSFFAVMYPCGHAHISIEKQGQVESDTVRLG